MYYYKRINEFLEYNWMRVVKEDEKSMRNVKSSKKK